LFFVGPPLIVQFNRVVEKLPRAGASLMHHLPPGSALRHSVAHLLAAPLPAETWAPRLLDIGQLALTGVASLILVGALVTYLLIDGRRSSEWMLAFFRLSVREKVRRTVREVTPVISAYVVGQAVTSAFSAVFVFAILRWFDVPAALMLAVVAGFCDVLPVIGFFLSALPAALFALTVSPEAAVLVFLLFVLYHAFENYVLVPLVYGRRLRLPGLVVVLGLIAGAALGGVLGAILALPILASYPIIEEIWLQDWLGARIVTRHAGLESGRLRTEVRADADLHA
jgi:predicted PurR-regulated permease PerM